MQNEQTLILLGFKKLSADFSGEWLWRGNYQKFTAKIGYDEKFVELFLVSPEIDDRKNSNHRGHHYRSFIKDCCSSGSVERALLKYDLPEEKIERTSFGIYIKN